MRATTMLLAAMVLFVIVMNGVVYLNPQEDEGGAAEEPFRAATATDEPNAPSPKSITGKASPTPTQWSTATPQPTASPIAAGVAAPVPHPTPNSEPTLAPTSLPTSTPWSEATPRPTASPITIAIVRATPTPTPVQLATPTPTPVIVSTPAPTPTVAQTPAENPCTDADKARERETIISVYGGRWRRSVEGERQKIIAENTQDGAANVEAVLGEIEYATTFIMSCRSAVVTLRYVWQVRMNVNGTIKARPVARGKRVACTKVAGTWLCR